MNPPALGHFAIRRAPLVLACLWFPLALHAENWPQWRGPLSNGSSGQTGLPDSCDPAKAKWVTAMPGAGYATPIVWGERVFVTSTDPASKGLLALCVNASDGKVRWHSRITPAGLWRPDRWK